MLLRVTVGGLQRLRTQGAGSFAEFGVEGPESKDPSSGGGRWRLPACAWARGRRPPGPVKRECSRERNWKARKTVSRARPDSARGDADISGIIALDVGRVRDSRVRTQSAASAVSFTLLPPVAKTAAAFSPLLHVPTSRSHPNPVFREIGSENLLTPALDFT
jgi:hypothetical protein